LRRVSNELADTFGWKQEEAVWFVLTGETPQIKPLSVRLRVKGSRPEVPLWSVTIDAEPWVPQEEVESAFGRIKQQVLQVRSRKMGSRKMGPRALEVYRFVREQERLREDRPTWPVLLELWNSQHPDKRFETYNNLRQYFMRGAKAVEAPGFKPPKLKDTPPKVKVAVNAREERMVKMLQAYAEKTANAPLFEDERKSCPVQLPGLLAHFCIRAHVIPLAEKLELDSEDRTPQQSLKAGGKSVTFGAHK